MRRTLVAVALTSSLVSPSPAARLLGPLWSLLSSLWGTATVDAGCGWDPYGRCQPAAQPQSDVGCGMDPWGHCS